MSRDQTAKYRDRLRVLATRLGAIVAGLEDQVRTPTGGESAGGLSNAPMHLADVGSEAYNQELGATLLENEAHIRDQVTAALARIENGKFGQCENCRQEIAPERLDALPYTPYCTKCATALGSGKVVNLNDGRPDTWLGKPGYEGLNQTGSPERVVGKDLGGDRRDSHAAGTPGGGTAVGGLAGTNLGGGSLDQANLEDAMASGNFDSSIEADEEDSAYAGPAGGAVGGTPANKRARGGKVESKKPESKPAATKAKAKAKKPPKSAKPRKKRSG